MHSQVTPQQRGRSRSVLLFIPLISSSPLHSSPLPGTKGDGNPLAAAPQRSFQGINNSPFHNLSYFLMIPLSPSSTSASRHTQISPDISPVKITSQVNVLKADPVADGVGREMQCVDVDLEIEVDCEEGLTCG
jgi:hypothetical protein